MRSERRAVQPQLFAADPFFCCTPVDRTGVADYIVLIRAPEDPERRPRFAVNDPRRDVSPHLTQRKTPAADWLPRILAALADGVPRTFNRICVEMLDQTTDVACDGPLEEALWALVGAGRLAHTMQAPIYFALNAGDCA